MLHSWFSKMDMFYLRTLLLELLEKQYVQLGMLPLTVTLNLYFPPLLEIATPISMYDLSTLGCLLFGAGCEIKLGEASIRLLVPCIFTSSWKSWHDFGKIGTFPKLIEVFVGQFFFDKMKIFRIHLRFTKKWHHITQSHVWYIYLDTFGRFLC